MAKTPDSATDIIVSCKTPEEIKKGLKCCSNKNTRCRKGCPYFNDGSLDALIPDALALIEQLERERDAAIEQLKEFDCATCKHCNIEHIASICCKCKDASNWEWQGVKEEKNENA